MARQALGRPAFQGHAAGVLHRVLGEVEIAGQAHDRGDRGPPVLAEQLLVQPVLVRLVLTQLGTCAFTTGRISTEASRAAGMLAAHLIAGDLGRRERR